MWFWINLFALIYVLFMVVEETIYFLWTRYVYGPKDLKPRYWKNRIFTGFYFLLRLRKRERQEHHPHKLSS